MKKILAVAAILGLAGAAQAQVTLYGLVDVSVGQNQIAFPDQKVNFFSGGDNLSSQGNSTTRVGIKGSTAVATGIKANFNFETAGIGGDGAVGTVGNVAQPFFNRQAWAGLSGSFGEVRVGKQDSVAFQTMIPFDLNGAANAASAQANAGAATFAPGRVNSSLQYISPVMMGGFKAQLGLQLKGDDKVGGIVNTAKDSAAIGLTYTAGPLAVAYTGESKRFEGGADFNSVAASYDLGVAKVMLGYADGGVYRKGTTVGVVAPLGGFNVGGIYSMNSDTNIGNATELFINKEIFKGTYAYFDYGNKDKINKDAYALGVIFTF